MKRSLTLSSLLTAGSLMVACSRAPIETASVEKASLASLTQLTVSDAFSTRFKSDFNDHSDDGLNPDVTCAVGPGVTIKLKKIIEVHDDNRHILVELKDKLPKCNLVRGYFYAPHLRNWEPIVRDLIAKRDAANAAAGQYSSTLGNKLANAARRTASGIPHSCYADVSRAMIAAGMATNAQFQRWIDGRYSDYAVLFARWANANPNDLRQMHLKKSNVSLAKAPVGSVVVYEPYACGGNAFTYWGHIEVITVPGREAYHWTSSNFPATCNDNGVHIYVPVN